MTKFAAGQDIVVSFGDIEHQGEVISHRGGYVMAVILLADSEGDYGSISARLDPRPTVCVKESKVRAAEGDAGKVAGE